MASVSHLHLPPQLAARCELHHFKGTWHGKGLGCSRGESRAGVPHPWGPQTIGVPGAPRPQRARTSRGGFLVATCLQLPKSHRVLPARLAVAEPGAVFPLFLGTRPPLGFSLTPFPSAGTANKAGGGAAGGAPRSAATGKGLPASHHPSAAGCPGSPAPFPFPWGFQGSVWVPAAGTFPRVPGSSGVLVLQGWGPRSIPTMLDPGLAWLFEGVLLVLNNKPATNHFCLLRISLGPHTLGFAPRGFAPYLPLPFYTGSYTARCVQR